MSPCGPDSVAPRKLKGTVSFKAPAVNRRLEFFDYRPELDGGEWTLEIDDLNRGFCG